MKALIVVGILLVLLGGGLLVFGGIPYEERHEIETPVGDFGATTREEKRVPVVVSGTLLALGAVLTVVGAVKLKGGR